MNLFFKLALRNVIRHAMFCIPNGIGIALCVMVVLFIFSLSEGIESQIVSRNIRFETGAIAIDFDRKTAGFQNKAAGDSLFKNIVSFLDNGKDIKNYNLRIYPSNVILYFGENTQRIKVIGITENENQLVSEMFKITEGSPGLRDDEQTILISSGLGELLGMKTGDDCNLMLQSIDGTINLDAFTVKGMFRYTSQMNKFTVYMNYNQARKLYDCNLPSKILVHPDQLDKTDKVCQEIAGWMKCKIQEEGDTQCDGFEISSWKDHIGQAKALSGFNRYGMSSIAVFLILISFVGIWSMQVENINKRMRESGTLLSFGFSRQAVKKIFLYESAIIGFVSFMAGFLVVFACILFINSQNGIYLGDSASFAFGSAVINPVLTAGNILMTFVVALAYPLLATLVSLHSINKTNVIRMIT